MRNCKATLSKRAMASVDTAVVDVWQREVGELSNRKFANRIAASQSKRAMANVDMAVADVWQREVGELSNRKFTHRLAASLDLVLRLDVSKKLEKNYVKTVNFNADGNIDFSLWLSRQANYAMGLGNWDSQAYFRVRSWGFMHRLLAKHQCNASDLALETGSPHLIYTCGEDGLVQHIDLRNAAAAELIRCQPIGGCTNPVIPLYAIAIDPRNPNVFAVVGSDQYARLYDIRKYKCGGSTDFGRPIDFFYPPHVIVNTNCTFGTKCLAFSDQSELLVSEANGKAIPQVYKGHGKKERVDCLSFFGPKSEFVVSGSGNGRVYFWKKGGELVRAKKEHVLGVNCIESHPHTTVLASSGADGIKIWTPNAIDKAMLPETKIEQDQHMRNDDDTGALEGIGSVYRRGGSGLLLSAGLSAN
ncbi:hypothetical protein V6N13_122089 [Hibiscus sabdariffa]